jgi:hypothetical protein
MTLAERIGWVHQSAATLPTNPEEDLVATKWQLKELMALTEQALDQCRDEIHRGRRGGQAAMRG